MTHKKDARPICVKGNCTSEVEGPMLDVERVMHPVLYVCLSFKSLGMQRLHKLCMLIVYACIKRF